MSLSRTLRTAAVALAVVAGAAPAARAQLDPSWFGTWTGDCTTEGPQGLQNRFTMTLEVGAPTEDEKAFTWSSTATSDSFGTVFKDYKLRAYPGQPGWFIADEGNGINIDTHIVGDRAFQQFFVAGSGQSLTVRYRKQGDRMSSEIASFFTGRPRRSMQQGRVVVSSFQLTDIQACDLTRQAPAAGEAPAPVED